MLIKVGEEITVGMNFSSKIRQGNITDISIATKPGDPAGEQGTHVNEYDTDLKYNGSISFTNNNGQYWAYLPLSFGCSYVCVWVHLTIKRLSLRL